MSLEPANRFTHAQVEWFEPVASPKVQLFSDDSQSILSENQSPDLPFRWSANPYRGCIHACTYCYARRSHEYMELNAGVDFETKIFYKKNAASLLRKRFHRPSWKGEFICFSGVTDCYQSIEHKYKITRQCLDVCAEYSNPVIIITRSPLVVRDIDILKRLNKQSAIRVAISIPILDPKLCRIIEPGAPPPAARLQAISKLSLAGIPVSVSLSPLIPGLNVHEIPSVLQAAKKAGAKHAWMMLLRLPGAVYDIFKTRIETEIPTMSTKILNAVERYKADNRHQSKFGNRLKGVGPEWDAAKRLFDLWKNRLKYLPIEEEKDSPFQLPSENRQLKLFNRGSSTLW